MQAMLYHGVNVTAPEEMQPDQIEAIVQEEIDMWHEQGKRLSRVELGLSQDEVTIKSYEKSPITRLRRITGYLSSVDNFNDAKRAEERDRIKHGIA